MEPGLKEFIEGMPKIELHLHIEGSFEPELMFKIAERNGVVLTHEVEGKKVPYKNVGELKDAYNFGSLEDFLALYYQGMGALQKKEDYYDLTMAYLQKVKSQNVTHTEIFFDPQGHTERGIPFDTVIRGIHEALEGAAKPVEHGGLGMSSKLILSFLRHKSEEDAFKTLEEAKPYMNMIDGFGLDSSEKPFPPQLFARVYAAARATGKAVTAHAGEVGKPGEVEGGPEYVRQAVELLKVDRIDHGNRSLEDDALVAELEKRKMGLTVCPLSNLKLCAVDDMRDHPLKTMLDKGLKATVNSDDPAYFGGYMTENFLAVAEALNLSRQDVITLSRNAIEVSFLSPGQKAEKNQELDNYIAKFNAAKRSADKSGATRSASA